MICSADKKYGNDVKLTPNTTSRISERSIEATAFPVKKTINSHWEYTEIYV